MYVSFARSRNADVSYCRYSTRTAFTLTEVLVVIGLIAILIGLLMPAVSIVRDHSRRTVCLTNLRTLGQAMITYAGANNDRLPNGNPPETNIDYDGANQVMTEFSAAYVQKAAVFWCPSCVREAPTAIVTADPELPNSARVSYDFFCLYWAPEDGPLLSRLQSDTPLAWDLDGGELNSPLENHRNLGGNVVFSDDHAAWQDRSEWDDLNWPHAATQAYPYP